MKILFAALLLSTCAAPAFAQTLADRSGTIAIGGTSQVAIPLNTQRRFMVCQNPLTETETLLVNVGSAAGAAGQSVELGRGGSWTIGPNASGTGMPVGAVSVSAATTGHRFVCKEG